MSKIKKLKAREILDSRGNPTVEVEIELESGTVGTASVPSGASTGASEATELRDGDGNRFGKMGVLKAVENVNKIIAKTVKGMDADDQKRIDRAMIELDGSDTKSKLGANALLGVSLAVCRASANEKKKPLYENIANHLRNRSKKFKIPVPMFNILNGGQHSDSGLSIQEFLIVPAGIKNFSEQLRSGSEVFQTLKKNLGKINMAVSVGDEGGFAPRLESHAQALDLIVQAVKESGYLPGAQIGLALDAAANSFFEAKEKQYYLRPENAVLTREALINFYREFILNSYVVSVEDGLEEGDHKGWQLMLKKLGKNTPTINSLRTAFKENMIVGDDLLVTNTQKLKEAVAGKFCNAAIVKPNQIGTLTETLEFIEYAQKNKIKTIISHRSGETTDDFIADLSVAVGADFIKTGSLSRGERICKYNRLLRIAEEVEDRIAK